MKREPYGTTADGRAVDLYRLRNDAGMQAAILTFGGIIAALEVPDRAGRLANVVLGLDTLAGYERRSPHFGALTGRYANRIAGGRFVLDGVAYRLETNDGPNALHGGRRGFDKVVWQAVPGAGEALVLRYLSPDGEAGYPGNLAVTVSYTLQADNALRIDYAATTDKPTVLNLTNHSYFNLAGEGSGEVLDHVVTITADAFLPTDDSQIPTGEIRPVRDTPFDFTQPTPIGARIRAADAQLLIAGGYDHTWVLPPAEDPPRVSARVFEPRSGRVLEVLTDTPGLQFYTGNSLNGTLAGPSGRAYRQSDGFCLEAQRFPDAPNQPRFPSAVQRPGETFRSTTIFRFSTAAAPTAIE